MAGLKTYRTVVYDSRRWQSFRFRPGDIVISAPPKCGTTWMQALCAMLVLDTVQFDRPLAEISPWLDAQTVALPELLSRLDAQPHRRVLKTHTPLDGVPYDERVSYLCLGRDPRDVALSFEDHLANLDLDAFVAARAGAVGLDDLPSFRPPPRPTSHDPEFRFWQWVYAPPGSAIGPTLSEVLRHFSTYWARRGHRNTILFHYSDLLSDLPGQLRRLSHHLEIETTEDRIAEFADAATLDKMRQRADQLAPDARTGIWRNNAAFFARARKGQWREFLDGEGRRRYDERVAALVPPDLAAWAHHGQNERSRTEVPERP